MRSYSRMPELSSGRPSIAHEPPWCSWAWVIVARWILALSRVSCMDGAVGRRESVDVTGWGRIGRGQGNTRCLAPVGDPEGPRPGRSHGAPGPLQGELKVVDEAGG